MKGYSFAISCIWFAISFLVAAFFLFADSAINRGPTERSAQFQAFEGYVLDNNVIASYQVTSDLECSAKCLRDKRCFSFNYKTALNKMPSECQLNNANRSTCPDCFKVKKDTTYYQDAEVIGPITICIFQAKALTAMLPRRGLRTFPCLHFAFGCKQMTLTGALRSVMQYKASITSSLCSGMSWP